MNEDLPRFESDSGVPGLHYIRLSHARIIDTVVPKDVPSGIHVAFDISECGDVVGIEIIETESQTQAKQ